jgi:hypothetical protein
MTVRDLKDLVEDLVEYDKDGNMIKIEDIAMINLISNIESSLKKSYNSLYIKTTNSESYKLLDIKL